MSLFDLVIGNSGYPKVLMGAVGLTPPMVQRYRDHWLEREGDGEDALILALYTRLGGGNRPDYAEQLDQMHALPAFISDEDDAFDSTYCTLRFRLTKDAAETWLEENRAEDTNVTLSEVWGELSGVAEPIPRDMSVIWQAIIGTLGGGQE